ncbi:hypothetical protein [Bifidobacterium aemilianum]|uniref:hypothetical protein n=1 Tax=Bifidobacterium aemilianum TaxID=2493120 RepID=UPI00137526A9|nr:hypothetical protein [Bifidobacterium aemilianum]
MTRSKQTVALAVYAVTLVVAAVWLLSHEACAHPIGNLVAFGWLWVSTLGMATWIGGE